MRHVGGVMKADDRDKRAGGLLGGRLFVKLGVELNRGDLRGKKIFIGESSWFLGERKYPRVQILGIFRIDFENLMF